MLALVAGMLEPPKMFLDMSACTSGLNEEIMQMITSIYTVLCYIVAADI